MTPQQHKNVFFTDCANKCADNARWWMTNIDVNDIDDLGVMSKIQDVIELLRKVNNLTMDIIITIKNKSDK